MIFKLYAMKYVDTAKVNASIIKAKEYLAPLKVDFSDLKQVEEKETKQSLYEWILALLVGGNKKIKLIDTNYIQSLPHEGYDGVILFLNKAQAKETTSMYGAHTRKDGKSFIQVFVNNRFVKILKGPKKFEEVYQNNELNALRDGTTHALIHEVFHALSNELEKPDILHTYIEEGQFDTYKEYLRVQKEEEVKLEANGYILYKTALACLGTDVTPKDLVPDNVACVDTITTLIKKVVKDFPIMAGTWIFFHYMRTNLERFKPIYTPEKGAILIYPTGTGNGKISNGHVFICGENEGAETKLYSNGSSNGIFNKNYTLESARKRYITQGGFIEAFFRLL